MLYENKTQEDWQAYFQDSSTVHFYASSNADYNQIIHPYESSNTLGPAYLYLGREYCPISFYSGQTF